MVVAAASTASALGVVGSNLILSDNLLKRSEKLSPFGDRQPEVRNRRIGDGALKNAERNNVMSTAVLHIDSPLEIHGRLHRK